MALTLPRPISSDEFAKDNPPEGCYVACLVMLFIYWRQEFRDADWNLPANPDSDAWKDFGAELFEKVTIGGVVTKVFKEKEIPGLLKDTGMGQDLAFGEQHVENVLDSARTLVRSGIPTITFFDWRRLYKGLHSEGSFHSGIILDVEESTVRITDPSNLGGLGYQTFDHEQMNDAMANLPPMVQYFSPKSQINVEGYAEEASLNKWIPEEESSNG